MRRASQDGNGAGGSQGHEPGDGFSRQSGSPLSDAELEPRDAGADADAKNRSRGLMDVEVDEMPCSYNAASDKSNMNPVTQYMKQLSAMTDSDSGADSDSDVEVADKVDLDPGQLPIGGTGHPVDSVQAYLEHEQRLGQSLQSSEAKDDLPLAHAEHAWYCCPWQQIAWDGVISTNRWMRQVICAMESRGDQPLAHPTRQGRNVTLSVVNELNYGAGKWSDETAESLERNEYFAIYKGMFPGMARSFEQSLVSQRVEPEVERPVWTPEAVGWATISCDGRTSADSWLRQMVIRSRVEGGRPITHPVSGAKLTKSRSITEIVL